MSAMLQFFGGKLCSTWVARIVCLLTEIVNRECCWNGNESGPFSLTKVYVLVVLGYWGKVGMTPGLRPLGRSGSSASKQKIKKRRSIYEAFRSSQTSVPWTWQSATQRYRRMRSGSERIMLTHGSTTIPRPTICSMTSATLSELCSRFTIASLPGY